MYSKIERHYLAKLPDGEDAIITDTHKVINTLNSLCIEMDTRMILLKKCFCKNLKEYNKKFTERKLKSRKRTPFLPLHRFGGRRICRFIMTAGKEVNSQLLRLAQLARAVGIHLIIATLKTICECNYGMIKVNFPARAAFRVISSVDSKNDFRFYWRRIN